LKFTVILKGAKSVQVALRDKTALKLCVNKLNGEQLANFVDGMKGADRDERAIVDVQLVNRV